jgi:hypothetical protein
MFRYPTCHIPSLRYGHIPSLHMYLSYSVFTHVIFRLYTLYPTCHIASYTFVSYLHHTHSYPTSIIHIRILPPSYTFVSYLHHTHSYPTCHHHTHSYPTCHIPSYSVLSTVPSDARLASDAWSSYQRHETFHSPKGNLIGKALVWGSFSDSTEIARLPSR